MLRLITSLLIITVFGFSQGITKDDILSKEGLRLIGGITFSNMGGKDAEDDQKYLMGYKFGAEKMLPNRILGGISYTQRGVGLSEDDFDAELTLNYLSLFVGKLFKMSDYDLFAGGEVGYFWSGKIWAKYKGESDTESLDRDDWKDLDGTALDFGLRAGIRYTYDEQIIIVGSYYFGIREIMKDDAEMNRSIQITISYALK